MNKRGKAYLIGGGIGNLAAAAFLIRDGGVPGENIVILESATTLGGALDAAGTAAQGYSMRGGRMLTTDNYECTWELFKDIPSLASPGKSVFQETVEFNEIHRSNAMSRLVDRRRAKVPVRSMGFSWRDRVELLRLSSADEATLGADRITDWLSPGFFETPFWSMWATTFAFQPWHSAVELKRYLHRFLLEFSRIETLGGVKRTVYNQYDSIVRPLLAWLTESGVRVRTGCTVTEIQLQPDVHALTVTALHCRTAEGVETLAVRDDDAVFFQNASMTDASSLGTMSEAPAQLSKQDSGGWALWERLAEGRPELGRPGVFSSCIAQSAWDSFTVTLKDSRFFDEMLRFSGNDAGTGGLVTFKDSHWLMSIVLAHQPHFANQPADVQVFWGYALCPDRAGDFVAKPLSECNGAEILRELRGHLRLDADTLSGAICIPCHMPYITSMFMPRAKGDRPLPVPQGSKNLALVSQFVEIPGDVVFTVEYSVRAAQLATYGLLGIDRPIPPIRRHDQSVVVWAQALIKSFE
jgi:oleate hydratase